MVTHWESALSLPADIERRLIIDIDDTCVDTLTGFVKWLASLNRLKNVDGNIIHNREHLGSWLNVPDNLAEIWIKEFCEQSWEWGALWPCLGAEKALAQIKQQGWHVIGYSKSSGDMHRATLRRANLELLFPGVFNELYVINRSSNFNAVIKENANCVCVTALESTALSSAEAGHITYLLNQPWNRDFSNISVRKFNNWLDIAGVLLNK